MDTNRDYDAGVDENGQALWRCSTCGRVGTWGESWGYVGVHEARRSSCGTRVHVGDPVIKSVSCSAACKTAKAKETK